MRLLTLEVKNWGPHEHLTCDLDSPITGIIGANGKGKSFLLTAISYAITGSLPMAKERYIREWDVKDPDKSGKGYKASVRLKFSAQGKEGEVERVIWDSGTSRSLSWDGKVLTRQAEVDQLMEDLMGADKAALQNAVFIQQGELTNLVKGTPSVRQETIRRLMNLNFLASRAEDAKLQLRVLELRSAADNSQTISDLTGSIHEKEEKVSRLEGEYAPYKKVQDLDPYFKKWNLLTRKVDDLLTQCNIIREQKRRAREVLSSKKEGIPELREKMGQLEEKRSKLSACDDKLIRLAELKRKELYELQPPIEAHLKADNALRALGYTSEEAIEAVIKGAGILRQVKEEEGKIRTSLEKKEKVDAKVKETEAEIEKREKLISEKEAEVKDELQNAEWSKAAYDVVIGRNKDMKCPICHSPMTIESIKEAEKFTGTDEELKDMLFDRCLRHGFIRKEYELFTEEKQNEIDGLSRTLVGERQESANLQAHCTISEARVLELKKEFDAVATSCASEEHLSLSSAEEEIRVISEEAEMKLKKVRELKLKLLPRDREQSLLEQMADVAVEEKKLEDEVKAEWNGNVPDRTEIDRLRQEVFREMCALSSAISEIENLEKQVNDAEESERKKTEQISYIRDGELNLLQEKLSAVGGSADLPGEGAFYELWDGWLEEAKRLSWEISSTKGIIAEEHQRLGAAIAAREKVAKIRGVAEDVRKVVDMLSRDGLPSAFMQAVFEELVDAVQSLLAQMGANFSVSVSPIPCSFTFTNEKGYSMPQESLSGGQAVRLALAMLLAAQRLILPEVGLLILDEPTSHVDAEGVDSMRSLFSELAILLQNAGMQLIVVDHNPALQAGFTKSIML